MTTDTHNTKYDMRYMIFDRLIESCLVFLIIFTTLAYGAVQPWSIAIFEITAALMLLFWILKVFVNGKFEFVHNPLTPFICLFILYIFLQLSLSRYATYDVLHTIPGSIYAYATKTEFLKVISYSVIFLVVLNTIKTRQQINRILSVVIAVGFLTSIFFIMRYFGANAPRSIINPDHYSAYLGMIIPLALGFLFVRHQTCDIRDTIFAKQILLLFCVIVMSTALFFTMSRGGMFSFIAALLFMAGLVLTRKSIKKKGWILSAVAIFIILTIIWLGATPVVERILSVKVEITSRYFGGRLPIWQGTLEIIKDSPILGTGFGTFNYIFPKYEPERLANHYTYAHSDFLELLSEVGIAGFSIFLLGLFAFAVHTFRHFRKRRNLYVIGMSIGIFGSLMNIFIHSFADFNLHIPAIAILVTIILALSTSILKYKQDSSFSESTLPHPTANRRSFSVMHYASFTIVVVLTVIYVVASVRPALADYYLRNSKHEIQNTKLAIKLAPTNAAYHYQLGKLIFKSKSDMTKGNPERSRRIRYALDEYKKAVELNPTNSKYHQSLAWAYAILADLSRTPNIEQTSFNRYTKYDVRYTNLAHKHFQQAIYFEPNNLYRHRTYAIWLFNTSTKKNIKRGVEEYRKAVEFEPSLTEEALTTYYKYQKNYEKTADILPGTEKSDYRAYAFLINEKGLKFAIDFAQKFLKTYPYNAELNFWIAHNSFYDSSFPWDFTEYHYTIAFNNDPDNGFYRLYHGIHLFFKNEVLKAKKDLEKAIEMGLEPGNEKLAKKYIAKAKIKMQNKSQKKY